MVVGPAEVTGFVEPAPQLLTLKDHLVVCPALGAIDVSTGPITVNADVAAAQRDGPRQRLDGGFVLTAVDEREG